ncbi:MAG: Tat pathway signal protein, partial [Candidatus Obscuribacter sp.]|nr:Tat pathway signal protein [Candidatus Obscuribacter sp.]
MKTYKPKANAAAVLANSLPQISRADELMLESVSRAHFQYFVDYQDKDTGLILDRTRAGGPATIAGVGFALTAYAIASERFWISRKEALDYTVRVLEVLARVPQGDAIQGTNGYRGFFYHFLDPKTGERATAPQFWNSELSSIDTALLMMGVRFAINYWRGRNAREKYVRDTGRALYDR